MPDWKTLGFVPDSDDEGDTLSPPAQISRDKAVENDDRPVKAVNQKSDYYIEPSTTSQGLVDDQTIAERLERALHDGLQLVRDARAAATTTPVDGTHLLDSADDSPLSSLSSSIAGSPPIFLSGIDSADIELQSADIPQLEIQHGGVQTAHRRSLRARAPIQQHPYMLEDAKYRQLMKDRGIKPINVPTASTNLETQQTGEESQQTEDYQSSQIHESFDFDVPSSPDGADSGQADLETQELSMTDVQRHEDDLEDVLPDLAQILQERDSTSKKTYRVKGRRPRPLHSRISLEQDSKASKRQSPGPLVSPRQQSFRVPPSPPGSDNEAAIEDEDDDVILSSRRARGVDTPNALPTPLVSSDHGFRKRRSTVVSVTDSESDDSAGRDDISRPMSPADDGNDSQGLQWIRHRLKGILPPSYVKLDIQNQAQNRSRHNNAPSTSTAANERGVARRTISGANRLAEQTTDRFYQFGEAESSDSDGPEELTVNANQDASSHTTYPISRGEDVMMLDDVVEVDEVDHMLPPSGIRRNKRVAGGKAFRQQRIDNDWAVLNRRSAAAASVGSGSVELGAPNVQGKDKINRKRTKLSHKRRPDGISVFDAPAFQDANHSPPQFVKVAARRAKKSHRQSYPSQKLFVLATEEDTQDVNDQLKLWEERRGKEKHFRVVAGASTFGRTARPPSHTKHSTLHSRSLRPINTVSEVNPEIADLKSSTHALLSKVSKRGHEIARQTIKPVDVRTDDGSQAQDSAGHLRSIFAHRNRSGQGQFYSRTSKPRAAQVESRRPPSKSVSSLSPRTNRHSKADVDLPKVQGQPNAGNLTKPKKPRKQTPRRSTLPTAQIETKDKLLPLNDLPVDIPAESTQPQLEEHDSTTEASLEDWVRVGILAVKNLRRLPAQSKFTHRSLVGGNTLSALSRFMQDASYVPSLPKEYSKPITTPVSVRVVQCGRYNSIVSKHIFAALDEIYNVFFAPDAEPALSMISRVSCAQTLQDTLIYLEEAVLFRDTVQQTTTETLIEFVQDFGTWLEKFVASVTHQYLQEKGELKISILHCLNWSACLAMHLHLMARNANLSLQTNLYGICWTIIGRTLEIVFEPESLVKSLGRLQDTILADTISRNLSDVVGPIVIDERCAFPEAESVLVAWHISCMDQSSSSRFYEHLRSALSSIASSHWSAQLALTSAALSFVLPLTQFTLRGVTIEDSRQLSDCSGPCFDLLIERLQDLVMKVPSGKAPALVGQILETVEDLCLKMNKLWFLKPPPGIATAFLRAYGWNAMLPFNTLPDEDSIFNDLKCLSLDKQYHVDNDFFKFLDIVESCMQALCDPMTNREQSVRASKVRAFVFSLIPNNSQTVDAREALRETQFLSLKNYCSLYICLLTRTPEGFQPRFKQLERQIDLTTSHYRVCQVAIATWESLAVYHMQRVDASREEPRDLRDWMNHMLDQAILRFTDHQQFDAMTLLEELLSTLTNVVTTCKTEVDARMLLRGEIFNTVARLLNETELHRGNEKVIIAGLQLLHAYVTTVMTDPIEDTLLFKVQLVLRNLIQEILSHNTVNNASLLRLLMHTWFVVAEALVRTSHKHWNDFVEPHSNLSIDFLSGLRNSYAVYEAKQCFFGDLIQTAQSFYFLECRPVAFTTWIVTLLLPVQSMRFGHILTESILRHETDSLMMKDLAAEFFKHDKDRKMVLQDVVDSRITILRHIIQNIYAQQWDPEEEWLAGGLDLQVQKDLLRTMTKTMKTTWLELQDDPVSQSDYTALIHAVLNEMETYPVQGFKIDPWFTGYGDFPRPKQTLDNIFKCRFGESGGAVTKDAIHDFRLQYIQAFKFNQHEPFLKDMIRVFHCTDPLRSRRRQQKDSQTTQYSIDFAKQAQFIQIVFPAIINCASKNPKSIIADPILALLTHLTQRIQFRIDNLNPDNMTSYFTTTALLLAEVSRFLKNTDLSHRATPLALRYIRAAFLSVWNLVEHGVEIDESTFETCVHHVLSVCSRIWHFQGLDRRQQDTPYIPPWSDELLLCSEPKNPDTCPDEEILKLREFTAEQVRGWEAYSGNEVDLEEEVRVEAGALVNVVMEKRLVPGGYEENE